jgi:squalene-hopene/tetraprenyl-beta-curcumene cyclase
MREAPSEGDAGGWWRGHLSTSALATATASWALRQGGGIGDEPLVRGGMDWLLAHQNPDGGWGDTPESPSNIAATMLSWCAVHDYPPAAGAVRRCESWLCARAGSLEARDLCAALERRYGHDRTFAAPILSMCAQSGRLGSAPAAWRHVAPLPFELAACPHGWLSAARLPVVSYALPALIAVGLARHVAAKPLCPVKRALRALTRRAALAKLAAIQPEGGGFLEATPLTSFVVMNLIAAGETASPPASGVADRGLAFLRRSVRQDGGWPIDTDLRTWVTTLAVRALERGPDDLARLQAGDRAALRDWLLRQQWTLEHPYTHAAAGGWAWTSLPGGVSDADDTASALLALRAFGAPETDVLRAAAAGVQWLAGLQNRDGGVPTFCRGWGRLDFDRSAPELTAHAVAAWSAWRDQFDSGAAARLGRALERALAYLRRAQRGDGSFVPLWFGNQLAQDEANPVFGTSRVVSLLAGAQLGHSATGMIVRGGLYLLGAQGPQGGWGGERGIEPSIEETSAAVEALAAVQEMGQGEAIGAALRRGVGWLLEATGDGTKFACSPIGLYFAKLWYWERLYPVVLATGALRRAAGVI